MSRENTQEIVQGLVNLVIALQAKYSLSVSSSSEEISSAVINYSISESHLGFCELKNRFSLLDQEIVNAFPILTEKGLSELVLLDSIRENLCAKIENSNSESDVASLSISRKVIPSTKSYAFKGHNKLDIKSSKIGHALLFE